MTQFRQVPPTPRDDVNAITLFALYSSERHMFIIPAKKALDAPRIKGREHIQHGKRIVLNYLK